MPLDPNQQYAEILGRPDQQPSMTSYNPTVSQTLRNLVAGPQSSPTWTSIVDQLLGTGAQIQQQPGAKDINVLNALGVPDVPMGQTPSREDIQNQAMAQALKLKRYSSTGVYDRTYHMMDESGQKVGSLSTQWKPWKNELYVSGMQSDLPTSVPGTEAAHANAAAHSLGAANIRSIVDELKREYPKAETITAVRSSGARHSAAASGERGQFDEMPLASIDVSQPRKPPQPPSPSITAYHGSPHDFDKFSTSAIGTGEGAQAYGHGLYFAENPAVAEDYKNTIPQRSFGSMTESDAALQMRAANGDRDEAIRRLQSAAASYRDRATVSPVGGGFRVLADSYDKAAELLKSGWKPPESKMYQVNINADPEHFLDWDKPLSEQSEHIQNIMKEATGRKGSALANSGQWWHDAFAGTVGGDPVSAANALRQAGIPGIKYLDQGSRSGGEGTRNYVVFNDQIINILKKYGLAGVLSSGAITDYLKQGNSNAPQ